MTDGVEADPFARFRAATRARIGLGRAGDSLRTADLLAFQLAHARARDAVHGAVDFDAIAEALRPTETLRVRSAAADRSVYLRRPDLGRRLADGEAGRLPRGEWDVAFVVADGLSASAVQAHAAPTLTACVERLPGWRIAPVVFAVQARVALGDPIGSALGAALVVVLIGERPGLSVADSLGAYLTFAPKPGLRDSMRNCVSNIHGHGLGYAAAADRIVWLVAEATRLRLSGVGLKEDAPALDAPSSDAPPPLLPQA